MLRHLPHFPKRLQGTATEHSLSFLSSRIRQCNPLLPLLLLLRLWPLRLEPAFLSYCLFGMVLVLLPCQECRGAGLWSALDITMRCLAAAFP